MYCRWSAVSPHRRQVFDFAKQLSNRLLTGIGSRHSVRSLLGSTVKRKSLLCSTVTRNIYSAVLSKVIYCHITMLTHPGNTRKYLVERSLFWIWIFGANYFAAQN